MSRDQHDNRLLLGAVGAAALILMTMITAIFLVSRRPVVVVTGSSNVETLPAVVAGEAPSGSGDLSQSPANQPPPTLSVSRVDRVPAVADPLDPTWDKIAAVEVPLAAQQVAQPALEQGTVPMLTVQAIRDNG